MIDPSTLGSLSRWYASLEAPPPPKPAEKEAKIENLQLILQAKDIWEEIKPQIESSEFFQIMIDGGPGSGKTTMARELAHYAHADDFYPLYSSAFNILTAPVSFIAQAKQNSSKKVCIVLDDMSYALAALSSKTQSKLKNFISMLRHALNENGTVNPQIFLIVIAHFTTAVPPLLKNANIWIFSRPTTQEYDHMIKIVGRKQQLRQRLEVMFDGVRNLQASAEPKQPLEFSMYGYDYNFTWDIDGRISLILKNGESYFYHSRNVSCNKCESIGKGITMNPEHYAPTAEKQDNQAE